MPTRSTKRLNRKMMMNHSGHVRLLAPPFERCPHCDNMNTADVGTLWRVADERGTHLDCDACGASTPSH